MPPYSRPRGDCPPALLAAAAALLHFAFPHPAACATTHTWNGGATGLDSSWVNASDWTPAGVPANGDSVVIPGTTNMDTTVNYNYAGPPVTLASLTLDHSNPRLSFATSVLTQSANALSATDEYLGDTSLGGTNGRGRIDQSGGTNTTSVLVLGRIAGTVGTYTLSGPAATLNATKLFVGDNGAGFFTQSAGTVNATNLTLAGSVASSTGSYTQTGGSLVVSNQFYIGAVGSGSFSLSGGAHANQYSTSGASVLGNSTGSSGSATVSDPGTLWNAARLFVGSGGPGSLTIQSGAAVTGAEAYIGYTGTPGATGTATITGAGSSWSQTNGIWVGGVSGIGGSGGTGTLSILAGAAVSSPNVNIGGSPNSTGSASISGAGSSWTVAQSLAIGPLGAGTLTLDPGATVSVADTLYDTGTLHLRGGTLAANTLKISSGTFDWTAGRLQIGAVDHDLTTPAAGTLAPGFTGAAGSASVAGNYTQQPGATLEFQIGGPPSDAALSDFLGVSAAASLAGTLQLSLLNSFRPQPRDVFGIITHASRTGTFDAIAGYAIAPGQDFSLQYTDTFTIARAGEWHDADLTGIIDVPGTKLDVTGAVHWTGTLVKQGAGALVVDLSASGGSSSASPGAFLQINAGQVLLKSDVGSTSPNLSIHLAAAGTLTLDSTEQLASLEVDDARLATLTAAAGAHTLRTASLALHTTGSLDLTDNLLILDLPGAPDVEPALSQLRTYLFSHQLYSSTADADPDHLLALGYADNSLLNAPDWGTLPVDATSVLAKLTYKGDANLDGQVDADDYALLDRAYAQSLPNAHWTDGDFNYDGLIDQNDYLLIDTTLGQAHGFSPAFLAQRESQFGATYVSQLLASIPEPSLLPLLPLLLARRRRPR